MAACRGQEEDDRELMVFLSLSIEGVILFTVHDILWPHLVPEVHPGQWLTKAFPSSLRIFGHRRTNPGGCLFTRGKQTTHFGIKDDFRRVTQAYREALICNPRALSDVRYLMDVHTFFFWSMLKRFSREPQRSHSFEL